MDFLLRLPLQPGRIRGPNSRLPAKNRRKKKRYVSALEPKVRIRVYPKGEAATTLVAVKARPASVS